MILCISMVSVVTSFLFLILFIWIFFFLWLVWLKVCWFLLIFLKNQISITSKLSVFFFQSLFKLLFSLSYYSSFLPDFFSLILNFVLFLASLGIKLLYLLGIFLFHSWDRPALLTTSLLELLWLCYIEFGMLHFCFNLSLRMFWFLLWFLWWPLCCSVTSCLISTYLWIFLFFSFDWFLVSWYFGQRRH